jgi:hypothetical protein
VIGVIVMANAVILLKSDAAKLKTHSLPNEESSMQSPKQFPKIVKPSRDSINAFELSLRINQLH